MAVESRTVSMIDIEETRDVEHACRVPRLEIENQPARI